MAIIERYNFSQTEGPRTCNNADLSSNATKCHTELILHDGGKELFLCKRHAVQNLSRNHDLLAAAVIELAVG